MHPRSPYTRFPTDFNKLSKKHPSLGKLYDFSIQGALIDHHRLCNGKVDFTDGATNREISRCLLLDDFDLKVEFPEDRLCPPIPNRLNYVLWMEDLIAETRPDVQSKVVGIDIGTGASAIYPLLCCKQNPTWQMYALEVDDVSISCASRNIAANNMHEHITLIMSDMHDARILSQHDAIFNTDQPITFTMCNPPFYESLDDMNASESIKVTKSSSACTGTPGEMITAGGEVGFTQRQIDESLVLRNCVQWYSTMLGKLSSLRTVIAALKSHDITNYAVTEFTQGQTKRWGLAWSFMPFRPLVLTCRPDAYALQDLLPSKPSYTIDISGLEASKVLVRVEGFLNDFTQDWKWLIIKQSIDVCIMQDTWSRQARRRLARLGNTETPRQEGERMLMKVSLQINVDNESVEVLWRYGLDYTLFESFCGKFKQALRQTRV